MGRYKVNPEVKKTILTVSIRLNLIKEFKEKCTRDQVSVSSAIEALIKREVEL